MSLYKDYWVCSLGLGVIYWLYTDCGVYYIFIGLFIILGTFFVGKALDLFC